MLNKMNRLIIVLLFFVCFIAITNNTSYADGFTSDPDAINEKIKSVVLVRTFDEENNGLATGSGFMLFDNRTLVTNYHVIEDASSIVAESDEGYQYFLNGIIIADKEKDIAILQFMAPTIMLPLEYSIIDHKRGDPVVVIGSPKGLRNVVSTGIISSLYQDTQRWIQFTAPASPGSSGGPVFDNSGLVIGMTTWNVTEGQNLNFAIDIRDIIELYQEWDGQTVLSIKSLKDFQSQSNAKKSEDKTITRIHAKSKIIYIPIGEKRNLMDCVEVTPSEAAKKDLVFFIKKVTSNLPKSSPVRKQIEKSDSDNDDELWFSSSTLGEKTIYVEYKYDAQIAEAFTIVVVPKNGIMADLEWEGTDGKGMVDNIHIVLRFKVRNPSYGKDIKAIEICIFGSDVWGTVITKPTFATLEKTIKAGTNKTYDILCDTQYINASNAWTHFAYGISRIAYTDGTTALLDFSEMKIEYYKIN